MSSQPLPNNIPVRVFLASLQEYSAYLYQWQAHAESETREVHSLKDKIAKLQQENEDIKDCRDILQRVVDTQRELVTSLEADLARVRAEQFSLCECESNSSSSTSTLSPVLDFKPGETTSYATEHLLPLVDPTEQPTLHKRVADVELTGSLKRPHREDSTDIGLDLAELLRS